MKLGKSCVELLCLPIKLAWTRFKDVARANNVIISVHHVTVLIK
jgi:hypothetical protein